ncbi:MAG TPA: hypothetical protein VG187_06515, partial [Mycobacterium sp.]|nr:hypothetical protein [Mycobacterium sp.]
MESATAVAGNTDIATMADSAAMQARRTQHARGRLGGFMGSSSLRSAAGWRRGLGCTIIRDVRRPR